MVRKLSPNLPQPEVLPVFPVGPGLIRR